MNKHEVIKGIESEKHIGLLTYEMEAYNDGLNDALLYVRQLDEPEKPVVPQFVADWYESHKINLPYEIYNLCIDYAENGYEGELYDWFKVNLNGAVETLVKMKLFNYDVAKEKRYIVEVPNPYDDDQREFALYRNRDGKVILNVMVEKDWRELDEVKLTEEEIKKDFGYLWEADLAKEVKE